MWVGLDSIPWIWNLDELGRSTWRTGHRGVCQDCVLGPACSSAWGMAQSCEGSGTLIGVRIGQQPLCLLNLGFYCFLVPILSSALILGLFLKSPSSRGTPNQGAPASWFGSVTQLQPHTFHNSPRILLSQACSPLPVLYPFPSKSSLLPLPLLTFLIGTF